MDLPGMSVPDGGAKPDQPDPDAETDRDREIARTLFLESNDGLFLFDTNDQRLVDLNPAALRMTGFERKAALGMPLTDLFLSHDPKYLDRLIIACTKTQFFHSREDYLLRRVEGPALPVNISLSRIHTKPSPLGLAVVRDVSERRRAQVELDRFFKLSPALLCILGSDGRFRKVNDAWQQTLGHSEQELRSMRFTDLLMIPNETESTLDTHPSLSLENDLADLLTKPGHTTHFECLCEHKSGSHRWLSCRAIAVDGQIYAAALDITDAKQSDELRRDKELAEAANQAKGRFLAQVSHELRTPLTAILGLVDLLLPDIASGSQSPDRVEDLQIIRRNGDHLLKLINVILDLSKIESGRLEVERVPCEPARITADVLALMSVRAESKGLALRAERIGTVPKTIRTDPVRFRQVLINLIDNAIKFTGRGNVTVRMSIADQKLSAQGEPLLRVEVSDTGIGMSEEEMRSLFQPFHQASPSLHRTHEGTGLGLAISRSLAELLGGSVTVTSQLGHGSVFTLEIAAGHPEPDPRSTHEDAAAPQEGDSSRDQTKTMTSSDPNQNDVFALASRRILLVEDNDDARRAFVPRLLKLALHVEAAGDGQKACEIAMAAFASESPFDWILMDMQMPVIDGFEATRRLRSQGYDRPIIAMTAYATEQDRRDCLRFGCDDYISKPIDWNRLIAILNKLLMPKA
jgi:PAS domain S-box-containing protein